MQSAKHFLTLLGQYLPRGFIRQLKSVVNYLMVGKWMQEHGFCFRNRVKTRLEVLTWVATAVSELNVLYLEFGVFRGDTMRFWSRSLKNPNSELHGFDSFEGLPEAGGPWSAGQFDTGGKIPVINDARVRFFKGWFNDVLPSYTVPEHDVLVINFDADLYSSTIYVLNHLRPYMKPGTWLYFDEFNHLEHEPRAFDEFLSQSGLKFRGVCADETLNYVLFQLESDTKSG